MANYPKRDPYWDLIRQYGTPVAQTLPSRFIGEESKRYLSYYRWNSGLDYYLYEVTDHNSRQTHYEIFKRILIRDGRVKRELFPWEAPVFDGIEYFSQGAAANYRFAELLRETTY